MKKGISLHNYEKRNQFAQLWKKESVCTIFSNTFCTNFCLGNCEGNACTFSICLEYTFRFVKCCKYFGLFEFAGLRTKMYLLYSALFFQIVRSIVRFCNKYLDFCKGIEFLQPTLIILFFFFAPRCNRPLIFQNINSNRSHSLSLKYQRFTPEGYKDIEIRKF